MILPCAALLSEPTLLSKSLVPFFHHVPRLALLFGSQMGLIEVRKMIRMLPFSDDTVTPKQRIPSFFVNFSTGG